MTTLQEQAAEIAVGVGTAFCRENDIPRDEREDCVQVGVLAALEAAPLWRQEAKLSTFLYPRVRGAIRDYRAETANRGMASKHIRVPVVSLHDEVPHTLDFDGDPLRYEDVLSYANPPLGYDDPLIENMRMEAPSTDELVADALTAVTKKERDAITGAFGVGRKRTTQQAMASRARVSQAAVARSIKRGILKMSKRIGCISPGHGADKETNGKKR